ncbi:MAG: acetyltransferase [Bacteroidota bacterium]
MSLRKLVIVGAGGFAREVYQLASLCKTPDGLTFQLPGFIAPLNAGHPHLKAPILGDDQWAFQQSEETFFCPATGFSQRRAKWVEIYSPFSQYKSVQLIHPKVQLNSTIRIGEGSIICEGVCMTTDIQLGKYSVINLQSTIGHDCIFDDFVTLHPGVRVSGDVQIGKRSEIGTGAIILPGVRIGSDCVIGAGAVVNRHCEDGKTYVGVPAKELKK